MDLFDQLERDNIYSVSEINLEIKELLETSIPSVWVQGEISNFTHHSSGHMYFSLKDVNSQISCVMWKSRNMAMYFTPTDGMKVNVYGAIRVYEKRGTYQIDIYKMMPSGIGELQIAFEQLKARLNSEGLFDHQYKKTLPQFPETVGIVTSPTGAAIRDIKNVINRRFPAVKLILRPAKVQGEGAAQDIASAIDEFNEYKKVDVLIVGRGGGSLEDLWAFNEEIVARAVFRSEIPVVSAVGHEIDFTICDFVADLRAPTPSAAAELVVPDMSDIKNVLQSLYYTCKKNTMDGMAAYREQLNNIRTGYGFRRPLDYVYQYRQRLDELVHLSSIAVLHKVSFEKQHLNQIHHRLTDLSPESVLNRGYSICRRLTDKKLIKSSEELELNNDVVLQFYKGGAESRITKIFKN
ncbi:exodeoxyribonuclease VII large subunit [candidate division KSB1 bacterium]|nr:exodeoxyribonuclease VII large subunit [candidate division KSB1 bacterium]